MDLRERAQNADPAEMVKAKDRSSENMTDMMETQLFWERKGEPGRQEQTGVWCQ